MLKNNLIILLQSFSKKEMTRFSEFSHSPYHNKHKDVQALVGYLQQIFPEFTAKKCHRAKIYKVLFPKQKHDQATLALLFTYAFRLAKTFLVVEQQQLDSVQKDIHLLQALRQKDQANLYEKTIKQAQTAITTPIFRGSPFYWQQYTLAKERDLYFEPRSRKVAHTVIQEKQYFLDYFYLTEKLKDACELQVRSQILSVPFDVQFMDNILSSLKNDWQRYQNIPPIAVYYHLYRMLTEEDTAQYYQILPIIEQNSRFFPQKELKDIYTYIQNYCIKQINRSKEVFMEELLKIYKIQLAQHLLHDEKNQLSEWHYKNIVTLGLRLKERDWVNQFIQQYHTALPLENRENAYRFNRAAYAYHIGDYDTVLTLLLQVEYTNIQYSLGARWLLLRTYYELAESIAFFSLCDSFRLYLQRNQLIATFKKEGHEQAIRLVKKVFQLKLEVPYQKKDKTKKEKTKLQAEIIATNTVFNRSWIERKLNEILLE